MKKYIACFACAVLALVLLTAPACALTVPEALELLEERYYFDIPEGAYEADSLDELFQLLGDPYTYYMSREEYESFLDDVEGEVNTVGIGAMIRFTEQGLLVDSVVAGGSAQEAGIQAGDLIVAADGVSCVPGGQSHRELLMGKEGTTVKVSVLRDGQTREYTLTRRALHIPNTEITLLENGVGYIDCNSFGTDTGKTFLQALEENDSKVDLWILDLRDNAGGYTDSAMDMLEGVSGPGRYFYYQVKDGGVGAYERQGEALTQKPLIVLVNGESASASEVVAAGVRDTRRGIVIGSRTFGKGVGQNMLDETTDPECFDGDGLKVTTARFYTAQGSTTDKIGVIPTLLVDDAYAEAVAAALIGGSKETSDLCIMPEGHPFYVDPNAGSDVLAALMAAVPPQVRVYYRSGAFQECTAAEAAEKMGLDYDSRWFSDVADSRYARSINAMGAYRLLDGTAPGVFSPKGQLTRAQLCVMLSRVLNVTWVGSSRFDDVAQDAWYAGAVNAMAELGLVNGMGAGRFDPNGLLTQEQFLTIMGRMARYLNFAVDSFGMVFEEEDVSLPMSKWLALEPYSDWARTGVAVLAWGREYALGERSGDMLFAPLEEMNPSAPILREEAAAGMYEVLWGLGILP